MAKSQQKEGKQFDSQSILKMEGSEIILSQPQHTFPGKVLVRSINQHKGKYRTCPPPSISLWSHYISFPEFYWLRMGDQPAQGNRELHRDQQFKSTEVCFPPPLNVNSKVIHVRIYMR